MATPVTIGGITFNGAADGNGTLWRCKDVEGWGKARRRLELIDRTGGDGAVVGENQRGPRALGLDGWIIATSNTNAWVARNALEAAMDDSSTLTLVVEEPTPKQVSVYCADEPTFTWISDKKLSFSVDLIAPDPRKYATSESSTTIS